MAKLFFYYSAMNAGKTTTLLQSDYNYRERGMHTLLLTSSIDHRSGHGVIQSRIGLSRDAYTFHGQTDLIELITSYNTQQAIDCVLVDEAQFLTDSQVHDLCHVVDRMNIPVLCYGIRTDFRGELFPGSKALLALADTLSELKTICDCARKATMNQRIDENGEVILEGEQVGIGGNESYRALCRKCFFELREKKLASKQASIAE